MKTERTSHPSTLSTTTTSVVVSDTVPTATAAPDAVSIIRNLPMIAPMSVPGVPDTFEPLVAGDKWPLKKLADNQEAELDGALGELSGRGPALAEELGPYVPPASRAIGILGRVQEARTGRARAAALDEFYTEVGAVADHDAMDFIDLVVGEIEHVAKHRPQIWSKYPKTYALVQQRSAAIIQGKADAKAKKAEIAKAVDEALGTKPSK